MKESKRFIATSIYKSPCGYLILGAYDNKLCLCDWLNGKHRKVVDKKIQNFFDAKFVETNSPTTQNAMSQLEEYFLGNRGTFQSPLLFIGTDFQKKVWHALLKIPYGKTISYGELAESLGLPNGSRAVANACGANAISIFVPCHRIIGANGSLVGYDGGVERKNFLLNLESK